jgi:hypothetical protein
MEYKFYIDPYDPFYSESLKKILKKSQIVGQKIIEQTITEFVLKLSHENLIEKIKEIEYLPVFFTSNLSQEIRNKFEKFFDTKIYSIRQENDNYYPVTKGGYYIYREPSEIVTFFQWIAK